MSLMHAAPPIPSSKFLPRERSDSSALSTPTSTFSSSSSSDDEAPTPESSTSRVHTHGLNSVTGTPRKIRFAPLPDPRRAESELDDDDMLIHPLSRSTSIEHMANPSLSVQPASPMSPLTPAASPGPNLLNFPALTDSPREPKHRSRWSFLKPFSHRNSSVSPTSSSFNISTESLLTLGTINLFRTSSRESRRSVNSTVSDCSPLARHSSAASLKNKEPGHPLSRSQSLLGSQSTRAQTQPRAGSGTRMLNGYVYGRKRPQTAPSGRNPFANARDDEPSFVEWGYGGMGSVKNNTGSSHWNKLQASGTGLTAHQEDEDDGSGAAWVRKRKEARERAAKEKAETEARLAAGKEVVERSEAISEPTATTKPSLDETASTATPTQASKEHVTSAVTVPAPAPVQRHHSTKSHSSIDHAVNIVEPKPTLQKRASSSSEEEDGATSDDAEQDEDDSEEEEFENSRRRTALGAGVEKISRHNN